MRAIVFLLFLSTSALAEPDLDSRNSAAHQLESVKSLQRKGDLQAAAEALDALRNSAPPESLRADIDDEAAILKIDAIERALKASQAKDFDGSLRMLDVASRLGDEPEVEFLRGSAYFFTNRIPDAQRALARVLSMHPDANTAETTRYFLNRIREAVAEGTWAVRNPYWVSIDLSGGYNSNIYDDGESVSPLTPAPVEQQTLGAGYTLFMNHPFFIRTTYFGSWIESVGVPENRLTTQVATTNLTLDYEQWLLQLAPTYSYQTYGAGFTPYLSEPGFSSRIVKHWDAPGLGFGFTFLVPNALNSTYSYLSGYYQNFRVFYDYSGPSTLFTLGLSLTYNRTGDQTLSSGDVIPNAYTGFGLEMNGLFFLSTTWDMIFGFTYQYKSFTNQETPDDISRVDNELTGQIKFEWRVTPNVKLYATGSVDQNFSTLGAGDVIDKNYTQLSGLGGFVWDIFR